MRLPIALFVLLAATAGAARGQEPSIDRTIDQIATLKKQQADLKKQEETAIADLRNQLKALNERIDKLGLGGPGPKPPDAPPVVPPVPVAPLRAKLAAAFNSSAGGTAEKTEWAKDLAALYRAAAKLATDPSLPTATALKLKLKEASAALIGPDALKEVRVAVAGELAAVLPTTDAELSAEQRTAAAGLFRKLAEILEGL